MEMKVKQNSFKTVFKLFCFSFIQLCGQCHQMSGNVVTCRGGQCDKDKNGQIQKSGGMFNQIFE